MSAGSNGVEVRTVTPSAAHSAASQATSSAPGPATAAMPPTAGRCARRRVTRCPRSAATRAASRPAGPAPTTTTSRGCVRGDVPVRVLGLAAARRLADAGHDRVAGIAHLAGLVAADARPDPVGRAGHELGDEVADRRSGPGSSRRRRTRRRRAPTRPGRRRPPSPAGSPASADPASRSAPCARPGRRSMLNAGRLVEVGSGLLDARRSSRARRRRSRRPHAASSTAIAGAMSGVMPAHGASSSHDRRSPTTAGSPAAAARRGDHPAGEQQAVGAPLVAALVGQPGEELADQAVLAGVDLHAVAAGVDGELARRREAGDDGLDVVVLHPLRDLAAVDLGHPRRRPQLALAVGRRALAAGVVERRDHAARRARGRRRSAAAQPSAHRVGERRPLVRPVARRGRWRPRPRRCRSRRRHGAAWYATQRSGRARSSSPRLVTCGPNMIRFGDRVRGEAEGFEEAHGSPILVEGQLFAPDQPFDVGAVLDAARARRARRSQRSPRPARPAAPRRWAAGR